MARRTRRDAAPATAPGALAVFSIEGALGLEAAAPLRAALLNRRGADLAVDASAVRHLGALCAQVLASAALTWAADGRSFSVQAPSDAFAQAVRLLGLESILTTQGVSA